MGSKENRRTGIFLNEDRQAIVVMWRGQEVCQYASMEEFVDSHLEAIDALEKKQEDILTNEYRDTS